MNERNTDDALWFKWSIQELFSSSTSQLIDGCTESTE